MHLFRGSVQEGLCARDDVAFGAMHAILRKESVHQMHGGIAFTCILELILGRYRRNGSDAA